MPDIALIGAVLTSLKTATEIAKALRESDYSMEKAELKMRVADLTVALAEIKIDLTGIQETITQRDDRIAELEKAFQEKREVVRYRDAYYRLDQNQQPVGRPLCLRCWDVNHKLFELHKSPKDRLVRVCLSCRTEYNNMYTAELAPDWYKDAKA